MNSKRKQPLEVGDIVYLETVMRFKPKQREYDEFHVVEANKNSAYCVRHDHLDSYNKTGEKRFRTRIDQRTKEVMDSNQDFDMTHLLWFDEAEFKADVEGKYRSASDRS